MASDNALIPEVRISDVAEPEQIPGKPLFRFEWRGITGIVGRTIMRPDYSTDGLTIEYVGKVDGSNKLHYVTDDGESMPEEIAISVISGEMEN